MLRLQISDLIERLLLSANSRQTKQGVEIFIFYLKILPECHSDDECQKLLVGINQSLLGIESHGFLTDDEYKYVIELRKLQK